VSECTLSEAEEAEEAEDPVRGLKHKSMAAGGGLASQSKIGCQ
jgi:hypothetical protein